MFVFVWQAIPLLLQGSHLLATAPTGSGKTFAFLLPLLSLLKVGLIRSARLAPSLLLVRARPSFCLLRVWRRAPSL